MQPFFKIQTRYLTVCNITMSKRCIVAKNKGQIGCLSMRYFLDQARSRSVDLTHALPSENGWEAKVGPEFPGSLPSQAQAGATDDFSHVSEGCPPLIDVLSPLEHSVGGEVDSGTRHRYRISCSIN